MINFTLEYDEVVLINCADVEFDSSVGKKGRCDLALTNKRIIIQKKGILGKVKDTILITYPEVKMFEGLPQIKLNDKVKGDKTSVDIYTVNGQYEILYGGDKKKLAKPFVAECYKAMGEEEAVKKWNEESKFFSIEGVEQIAQTLKDTFDTVKDAIMPPEMTSAICKGCGGQINGYVGKVAKCTFCGSNQKL